MEFAIILIIVIIFVSIATGNLGYVLFGMSGLLILMAGFMVVINVQVEGSEVCRD